ncbi:hypothetical protein ABIE32_003739 [Comamonas sp. 4034]
MGSLKNCIYSVAASRNPTLPHPVSPIDGFDSGNLPGEAR